MSTSRNEFTCPKCGSHMFGRDTGIADGKVIVLKTVRCHGVFWLGNHGRNCDWRGSWDELKAKVK